MSKVVTSRVMPDEASMNKMYMGDVDASTPQQSVAIEGNLRTNRLEDRGGNLIYESDGNGNITLNNGLVGSMVHLRTQTVDGATGVSTIDFATNIDDTYDEYVFYLNEMVVETDISIIGFQASTDGGSSYGTDMSSTFWYADHYWTWSSDAMIRYDASRDHVNEDTLQLLCLDQDNGASVAGACMAGELHLFNPGSTSLYKQWYARMSNLHYLNGGMHDAWTSGNIETTSAVDGIRFKVNQDTMFGTISMYGIK